MHDYTLRDILIADGVLVPADEVTPARSLAPRLELDDAARRAVKIGKALDMVQWLACRERKAQK